MALNIMFIVFIGGCHSFPHLYNQLIGQGNSDPHRYTDHKINGQTNGKFNANQHNQKAVDSGLQNIDKDGSVMLSQPVAVGDRGKFVNSQSSRNADIKDKQLVPSILQRVAIDDNFDHDIPNIQDQDVIDDVFDGIHNSGGDDGDLLGDGVIDNIEDSDLLDTDVIDNILDGELLENSVVGHVLDGELLDNDVADNFLDGELFENNVIDDVLDGELLENDVVGDVIDGELLENDVLDNVIHGELLENDVLDHIFNGQLLENDVIDNVLDSASLEK